jgi:hypothetical protein
MLGDPNHWARPAHPRQAIFFRHMRRNDSDGRDASDSVACRPLYNGDLLPASAQRVKQIAADGRIL